MWEIRIIHPALSAARKTWDCGGKEDAFFLSFNIPLPSPRQTGATHGPGLPGAPRYCPGPSLAEGGHVCIRAARNQPQGFLCKKNRCKIFLPLVSSVRSLPGTPPCYLRDPGRAKAHAAAQRQGQHRSGWEQIFPRYPQQPCPAQMPLHTLHFSVRAVALGQIFS